MKCIIKLDDVNDAFCDVNLKCSYFNDTLRYIYII